jgi:sigma54-dependent transcription regulator
MYPMQFLVKHDTNKGPVTFDPYQGESLTEMDKEMEYSLHDNEREAAHAFLGIIADSVVRYSRSQYEHVVSVCS